MKQRTEFRRRGISAFLALAICFGLLPQTAFAAQTGSTDASRTVFDALGFSTKAPTGYEDNEGITDTPFGKTYSTLTEVDELFVMNTKDKKATLYGDGLADGSTLNAFWNRKSETDMSGMPDTTSVQMIEGNFSTANNGQKKNVVALSSDLADNGLCRWQLETLSADGKTGSPILPKQHLAATGGATPAALYNNCAITAGDFDGDGIDEIAFTENSINSISIIVYKLQETDGDSYLNGSNWKETITFASPRIDISTSRSATINMISLVAADINKDGIDDLAVAAGSFDPDKDGKRYCSKVLIAWGADKGTMLTEQTQLDIGDVYRAGIAVGDLDNDGRNELVIGGNTTEDASDRYVAVYAWNGRSFDKLASRSIDTAKDLDGTYHSLATNVANMAIGSFCGRGTGPCIYLDSIVLQYGSSGIDILTLVEWTKSDIPLSGGIAIDYSEWGARAADFTGSGEAVIGINLGAPNSSNQALSFASVAKSGDGYTASKVYSTYAECGDKTYQTRAVSFCLPNTDDDSIILRYTGKHYYSYADPEVLAVLASPPYFADLANDDDDSQMIESKTSYSSSRGSGGGSSYSNSFSVGVYTSWEHSFKIFNVEVAHAEAEASINNTFTWETQQTSSTEYEIEYSTMAGMDSVVLYALPIETYVYEASMADGTTQMMTVNKPYRPSVRTISADEYAEIQKVYSNILPDVSNVLTHTIGDPASYASDVSALPDDRSSTLVYDGNFATIGQGSQNTISQSIAMTSETEKSFNYDLDVETKAGAGAGGVTVGVTAGYSHGAGSVHITTAGSTYSGEMNGLPTQAQKYGYSFNWKLVGFLYRGMYPVVTYLVNSVSEPPLLPENFGADEDETTTDQIALTWDYPGSAAGFILYRYFQSPSSSGYYKIGTVEGGSYTGIDDGVKHYQFIDKGLTADTSYSYRIQTIGLSQPNTSIPSEALQTYTRPENGAPLVAVSADHLDTHPDVSISTTAYLTNSDEFKNATATYFQWQKQSGRSWESLTGEDAATLTFQYPDKGVEGVYRCKVSVLTGHSLVTAYSPEVDVTFAQREAKISGLKINGTKLSATVEAIGTNSKPSGTVNFILSATDGTQTIYTANVGTDGRAEVTVDAAAAMYKLTATYSGSKIFLPASFEPEAPLFYVEGVKNSTFLDVQDSYIYGDELNFTQYTIADGKVSSELLLPTPENGVKWYYFDYQSDEVKQRFYDGYAGSVTSYNRNFDYEGKNYRLHVQSKPLTITGLPETITVSIDDLATAEQRKALQDKLLATLKTDGLIEEWDGAAFTSESRYISVRKSGYMGFSLGSSSSITPGVYTMTPRISGLSNYDVSLCTGKLIVLGKSYDVSAKVADGQDTFGTVSVAYPENASTAAVGQTLIFKAAANPDYTVKQWINADTKQPIEGSEGLDSIMLTQTSAGTNVIVEFQKKINTLTTSVTPANAGKITTENKYFQNGNAYPTGWNVTFAAEPNDGWHFTGWEYYVTGQNALYGDKDTYTVIMPDDSVQLIAKFERDTYQLTLSDGLAAYDKDGKVIDDLSAITGDTEITVKPASGYDLDENAQWSVDGKALEPQPENGEYRFTITADTSVSAAATARTFSVVLDDSSLTGGTASLSGTDADGRATAGTKVTFTAEPSRGYDFTAWTDEKDTTVSTSARFVYTVGGDVTLRPVFTEKPNKTFTVGEKLEWSITDTEGSPVETDDAKLYPGETLTLTARPRSGDMVKGWTVNGSYTASVAKTRTFAYRELEDDNTFEVTFQPVTYFTVRFADNIDATADDVDIASGDSVAAGSRMVFTYAIAADTVTRWLNHGTAYSSHTEQLVIEALSGSLDISVETGELPFYEVKDETDGEKHYTVSVIGGYEKDEEYAENSAVTIKITPETDFRITDVKCSGADFSLDEDTGIWTAEIEQITDDIRFTVSAESTLPPAPVIYTIIFDANGGTLTGDSTAQTDSDGRLTALPSDPTRDGYRFDGWFTAAAGGEKAALDTVYSGDTTLYAHWTKETSGGGGSSGGSGGSSSGGSTGKPAENPPVTPVTPPSDTKEIKFTDTRPSDYYYDAVQWAVNREITSGTSETTFSPDAPCTRAQMATFLWRTQGRPETAAANRFRDVPSGSYYETAVVWALEKGITTGLSATVFGPDETLTRAQMVTMLWRAAGSPAAKTAAAFADVPSDSYYAQAVAWAAENGITTGTGNGRFSPNEACTRAQIVTFLYRTYGK